MSAGTRIVDGPTVVVPSRVLTHDDPEQPRARPLPSADLFGRW
jgi:hypothetical protein